MPPSHRLSSRVLRLLDPKVPPMVEVRPSRLPDAGQGVFTVEQVTKGQVVSRSQIADIVLRFKRYLLLSSSYFSSSW